MANAVHIIVTGKEKGKTLVVPYSERLGRQRYVVNGVETDEDVLYEVPFYEVRIEGGGVYDAVRFGLQNKGILPPIKTLHCNAGISQHHVCHPSWVVGYHPHTVAGIRWGAWRLFPGKDFLLHEGADRSTAEVGGSLGCIEILDVWNDFLNEIETIGKAPCPEIASAGKVKVTIQVAHFPLAHLAN
jgi:hypothetical protein